MDLRNTLEPFALQSCLFQFEHPGFGLKRVLQVKDKHFYNLNGNDEELRRGEIMICLLEEISGQLRRPRYFTHMIAPGPQHARVIKAYFDGNNIVMRPTKLYDLRHKDSEALTTLTQW
ncbi:conserved hypothetical protein [Talaromyces stipitatus ATCC 10500]|uniref:Uncharacterized protein n=1 Tax=Talaromyces stipitatus (strain ATCC 10500 / CBS 375.48 / QM 6759 / NRRL 1006) TaxID=441959 RepID=B8MPY9_TALSN|nr:uncharacterized protein TSTA_053910 [Talaromyces stipitatus ATCC 10500]EED12879.1 conserved hypothetical protein [Talaromyces stipitatus ATCC 10500]